jgi:hypothetical protein
MINLPVRACTLAAVLSVVAIAGVSDANAQKANPFDGPWSVNIAVTRGDCSSNSLYGVVIRGGRVYYAGGANVAVSGSVSPSGAVSVRVSSGGQSASGSGKLSGNSGGGSWSGQGERGRCSGRWSASRSG